MLHISTEIQIPNSEEIKLDLGDVRSPKRAGNKGPNQRGVGMDDTPEEFTATQSIFIRSFLQAHVCPVCIPLESAQSPAAFLCLWGDSGAAACPTALSCSPCSCFSPSELGNQLMFSTRPTMRCNHSSSMAQNSLCPINYRNLSNHSKSIHKNI